MKPYMKVLLALVVPVGVVLCGGCPAAAPPPEAVLAGSWALTTNQPSNLPPTVLNFDANGNFTSIVYTVGGATITQTPINGSTLVSGTTVTVSQSLTNGSSLNFVGQLNAANTQASGTLIATLNITSILSIQFSSVPATITKQ
jgi:hypothetical protein